MDKNLYIKSILQNVYYKDVKSKFGLYGQKLLVKCIKVVDGDTITIVMCYPELDSSKICKVNIRLYGINTPEKRSSDKKEVEAAMKCKSYLENLILNSFIWVSVPEKESDKYGRILGILYKEDELNFIYENSINYLLTQQKDLHCQNYFGGTKQEWKFN